jgi:hypothetical protein
MRSCPPSRLAWIACAAATLSAATLAADEESIAPLFTTSEIRTVEVPNNGSSSRARIGRIDLRVLLVDRLRLDLPDGRRLIARRTGGEARDAVHPVWSGVVDGVEGSAVSLTGERDGGVVGVVHTGHETFEIVPFWTGEVLLYGVGAECRPPYTNLASRVGHVETQTQPARRWATADGVATSTRRIIALYTPASRARWADYGGIESRIEAGLAALNTRSPNGPRLVLDHLREVDYVENGDARAAMRWLQRYLAADESSAPLRRDELGMSAVLLITEDNNLCGVSARPDSLRTRDVELQTIYSNCLTDPTLATQLGGGRAAAYGLAEDSSGRW